MAASEVHVRVRYAETDRMGHAYYANYLVWFELGRVEILRELGFAYDELEDSGIFLPVSRTSCSYRAPAAYDDDLVIATDPVSVGKGSITFDTTIRRDSDETLIARGQTKLACVGRDGRPRRLPEELRRVMNKAAGPKEDGR